MRLDQFVAQACDVSRKQAKALIKAGRITVAGERSQAQQRVGVAVVLFDGQPITVPGERYYMLHKPCGYVSATEDGAHATALSLLPRQLRQGLHIAGRLDKDTTGLLLLTTDGHWSRRVTAPRYQVEKTYVATLASPLANTAITQLEEGVMLHGESKPTLPAKLEKLTDTKIKLTIVEGRYHQVKRMLAAVNNRVLALHRERVGTLIIDSTLAEGEYRALTETEIASFNELKGQP